MPPCLRRCRHAILGMLPRSSLLPVDVFLGVWGVFFFALTTDLFVNPACPRSIRWRKTKRLFRRQDPADHACCAAHLVFFWLCRRTIPPLVFLIDFRLPRTFSAPRGGHSGRSHHFLKPVFILQRPSFAVTPSTNGRSHSSNSIFFLY